MPYADVILPLALRATLTYRVPSALAPRVSVGQLVMVPVRRKHYTGIIARIHEDVPQGDIKDITSIVESQPLVQADQLRLWRWLASYYMCTPGEVAKAALPAGFKDEDKMARRAAKAEDAEALLVTKPATSFNQTGDYENLNPPIVLSTPQTTAMQGIVEQWAEKSVVLLHGVTSSGKTEVYISLIQQALKRGEQVLFLVPEIALTTQLTTRLGRVFGDRMGVWHSKFTDKQRMDLWHRQLSSEAFPLVLGVRSAIFLPWQKLGLIIVDEEHEQSYKQQDPAPRYNARDVATVIGQMSGAKVLLGSATPSLESYYNAQTGKYGYVALTERYGGAELPDIIIEDMKELRRKRLLTSPFSPRLTELTRTALEEGRQAILFQNRRGYSPVLTCHTCGWTPRCTRCDVSLTYHQSPESLVCHYCGSSFSMPDCCPQCSGKDLRDLGLGTEKVETAAHTIFPKARIQRMDLDTTRSRRAYEEIITAFQQGKKNLLIGTQMVTKGLDFGRVKVVGIMNADQMLTQPDFRAHERSFQMLSQVAGRAGRREDKGLVVLQTKQPDLPVVRHIVENDYATFYAEEMEERRIFRYPPLMRIIYIYVKSPKDHLAESAARVMADMLRPQLPTGDLLGPERPYVARVSLQYIRRIMVKVPSSEPPTSVKALLHGARNYLTQLPDLKSVNIYFDVDPM